MSNSAAGGFLAILVFVGKIASWVGSGVVAWNWVEPESFGGVIVFLAAWAVMGFIFDLLLGAVILGAAKMME